MIKDNKMIDKQVNEIIAEFMGVKIAEHSDGRQNCVVLSDLTYEVSELYTKSLDALVPVWGKLDICIKIEWLRHNGCVFYMEKPREIEIHHSCPNAFEIHQAAAHATAKAILELRGNDG